MPRETKLERLKRLVEKAFQRLVKTQSRNAMERHYRLVVAMDERK